MTRTWGVLVVVALVSGFAGAVTAQTIVRRLDPFYFSSVRSVSAATTLSCASDEMLEITGASSFTVSLDPIANCPTGRSFNIKHRGTGTITIDPNSTETIDGATTRTMASQYTSLTIYKTAGGEWGVY